jgi:CBS domain-containing protein
MKRSILTEKVARRGYHVSREYTVDPLEMLSVGEVMTTAVVTVPAALPVKEVVQNYLFSTGPKKHQGYPVVDSDGSLVGVITRTNLMEEWIAATFPGADSPDLAVLDFFIAYDLVHRPAITTYPWESCRTAAERMAQAGVGRLPVVAPDRPEQVIGIITRSDILKPRARQFAEEMRRERFIAARRRNDGVVPPAGSQQ